jgi:hypothetical protein
MLAPSQHQRVGQALGGNRRLGYALQLGIEKGGVKAGIVGDDRCIADEGDSSATAANNGLSTKNSAVSPCTSTASAGIERSGQR